MEQEVQKAVPAQTNEFIKKFVDNKFRFESYLVQANILIRYDDFKKALTLLKELKWICNENKDYLSKCMIYQIAGRTHQLMDNHDLALKNYKKMLYLVWTCKEKGSRIMELHAYEGLAVENFYKGDVLKAKFYMDKAMRGKTEGEESIVKKVIASTILSWRADKEKKLNTATEVGDEAEGKDENKLARMPSLASFNVLVRDGVRYIKDYCETVNILPNFSEVDYQKLQIYGDKND